MRPRVVASRRGFPPFFRSFSGRAGTSAAAASYHLRGDHPWLRRILSQAERVECLVYEGVGRVALVEPLIERELVPADMDRAAARSRPCEHVPVRATLGGASVVEENEAEIGSRGLAGGSQVDIQTPSGAVGEVGQNFLAAA